MKKPKEKPVLTYGAVMAIEQCRAWLLLTLSEENCRNGAGEVLLKLRETIDDPDKFFQAVHNL